MLEDYLADLPLPEARACSRSAAGRGRWRDPRRAPGVGEVVGIDPSPVFVDQARELAAA